MEPNKIDYTEKIRTFQAMVDNYNEEIALNYLTKTNWDETKAASLFLGETTDNTRNSNVRNMMDTPHYVDDINQNTNRRGYTELSQNDNEINSNLLGRNRQPQEQGFFQRWVVRPLAYIGSFFCNRRGDQASEVENRIFAELPNRVSNLNAFANSIKSRIGIIVLYQDRDSQYFTNLVNSVKVQEYIMDILRENYCIYPVLVNSSEGKRIISLLNEPMLYPTMIFSYNRRDNNAFNRGSILDKLEGEVFLDTFRDALIRNIEMREKVSTQKTTTPGSLIQQQKEEMALLERMENERKKKEIEQKLKEEREREEKRKREEELEKLKAMKQKSLAPEPEADNKNSTQIIFRYPDGSRRVERRFLKSDPIQVLYDYVDSLGADVFEESDKYELIQPFPFKLYNKMTRTLEEEQLFPNAVLQIREI